MKTSALNLSAAAALAIALPLAWSQDKPKPPPAWWQGKPQALKDSPLAPHPPKLTETPAAEIPVDRIRVPPGFRVELWASGLPGGRAMAIGDSGRKIYLGTRMIGRVYEVTDHGDRRTVRVVADKLNQPAGVAFHRGSLYVMAIDRVLRFDGIEARPDVAPVDLTERFNLPPEPHHNWKYIAFGPDGKLYVPFGAPCNICEPPKEYAQLRRYNPDGSGMEVIATGIRNTVGFDWHPVTRRLWFTDHGRDWNVGAEIDDELNVLNREGEFFGFPHCHASGIADPDIRKPDPCRGVSLPIASMGPHTAVMGIKFYTGSMFPPEYQGAAFVARRGSWNRAELTGFDVVVVRADPDGRNARIVPFMTGFLEDAKARKFWGRPVYFAQLADGSLLVSDEQMGAIYRVSYQR